MSGFWGSFRAKRRSNTVSPCIVIQPRDETALPGDTVTLSATASGSDPLEFRWERNRGKGENWEPLPQCEKFFIGAGNQTSTLTIRNVMKPDEGRYRCIVRNDGGREASRSATLVLAATPQIHSTPQDQLDMVPGSSATLAVTASGIGPIVYSWEWNVESWQPVPDDMRFQGRNTATLTVVGLRDKDEGSYRCVVRNDAGRRPSRAVELTLAEPPSISCHPQETVHTVLRGTAVIKLRAAGSNLRFRWEREMDTWQRLPPRDSVHGADSRILTIRGVQGSDEGSYRCVVSNKIGYKISNTSALVIADPPTIVAHPKDQIDTASHSTVSFTVEANGTTPLHYSWERSIDGRYNWEPVPSEDHTAEKDSPTFNFSCVRKSDEGQYRCVVSNAVGRETSHPAVLTVIELPRIIAQPNDEKCAAPRKKLTLAVEAEGKGPLKFSWEWNPECEVRLPSESQARATRGKAASDTLRTHFTELIKQFRPQVVAPALFEKKIIDIEALEKARMESFTQTHKADELLRDLIRKVEGRPQYLRTVLAIFSEERVPQVDELQAEFDAKVKEKEGWHPLSNEEGHFEGVNTATLTICSLQKSDEGSYRCLVENDDGVTVSHPATVNMADPPQILVQPQDAPAVPPKGDAVFTIEVVGTEPLAFSWEWKPGGQKNEHWHALLGVGRIMGTDDDKMVIGQARKWDEGHYRCIVSNSAGKTVSEVATFTLATPPVIVALPYEKTAALHTDAVIQVEASGARPHQYQWQHSVPTGKKGGMEWRALPTGAERYQGVDTAILRIRRVQKADKGSCYRCIVSNCAGETTSQQVILDVAGHQFKRIPNSKMDIFKSKAAQVAFERCFDELTKDMEPETIAAALYSSKMISDGALKKARNTSCSKEERAQELAEELARTVNVHPNQFDAVCDVLQKKAVLGVQQLKDTFQKQLKLEELKQACKSGNTDTARAIISETNSDVEVVHMGMVHTIRREEENAEIFQVLLDSGVSPYFASEALEGFTPLQGACRNGHLRITRMLLERGADKYMQTDDGRTLLHIACENGNSDVAMELISRDISVHDRDEKQKTPLHAVCEAARDAVFLPPPPSTSSPKPNSKVKKLPQKKQRQMLSLIEMLLQRGAKCDAQDESGNTPLHIACLSGNPDIVKVLLKGDTECKAILLGNLFGETPLHLAAQCGYRGIVEILGEHGADPTVINKASLTPVDVAEKAGLREVAKIIKSGRTFKRKSKFLESTQHVYSDGEPVLAQWTQFQHNTNTDL